MNTEFPTGQRGKTIAVLLLLLVAVAFWRLLAAPLLDLYADQRERLEGRIQLLERLERLAAELPTLQSAKIADVTPRVVTLNGTSDAVAAANLQNIVQDLASGGGVTLGSAEILPAESDGSLRRIGLRLAVNGSMASTMRLIEATMQSEPPLLIDDLQIHANIPQVPNAAVRLDTSFAVYGFRSDDAAEHQP